MSVLNNTYTFYTPFRQKTIITHIGAILTERII